MPNNRIFISYRRADGANDAVRVKQRLVKEFGADCAFIDVDDISPGAVVNTQLNQQLSNCDILLAVIGPEWLDILNRRIDAPHDPVRDEVSKALVRPTFVIPIVLDGAKMPRSEDLPEDLQKLPDRNILNLSASDADLDRLVKAIRFRFENPLLARYEGEKLEKAFKDQELVSNIEIIAKKLARVSRVEEIKEGEKLYSEGDASKDVLFFILSGGLRLSDRGGLSFDVKPNEVIGEFPMLLPHQPHYVVTATARKTSVVARVSEDQFRSIAKDHHELWENMAKMLAKRIRDSNESGRVTKP
jgi:CRP-like cAMP-binding protein